MAEAILLSPLKLLHRFTNSWPLWLLNLVQYNLKPQSRIQFQVHFSECILHLWTEAPAMGRRAWTALPTSPQTHSLWLYYFWWGRDGGLGQGLGRREMSPYWASRVSTPSSEVVTASLTSFTGCQSMPSMWQLPFVGHRSGCFTGVGGVFPWYLLYNTFDFPQLIVQSLLVVTSKMFQSSFLTT